jgi:hypothetical protein
MIDTIVNSCFFFVLAVLSLALAAIPAMAASTSWWFLTTYVVVVPFLTMIWAMMGEIAGWWG